MTDDEKPQRAGPDTADSTPVRGAASQAASRARRMGTRPLPGSGGRPRPGPGPEAEADRDRPGAAADAEPVRPAARTRVAGGRRPLPGDADRVSDEAPARRAERRDRASGWVRWVPAGVAAALVVALAIVDVIMLQDWRNQPGKAERREKLVASVNTGVARILSYDYRHLDADESATAAHLTGVFKDQYVTSMNTTIKPGAPAAHAVVIGQVASSAVTSVSDDGKQAVLLLVGQQTVTNTQQKTPRYDLVNLRVTAQLVHGQWLVSGLSQL